MVSVAIVGAGPAGCELARRLSAEFEVFLIDPRSFPRNKPCGGILIEEAVEFLEELCPPKEIFSIPKQLNLLYKDFDNKVEMKQNRGFCNINRKNFDYWLFGQATKQENVKFVQGGVRSVSLNKEFSLIIESSGVLSEINANFVVDASGAYSILGEHNLKRAKPYVAIQFELNQKGSFEEFYYIFANTLSDYYSWIIPKGNSIIVGSCFNSGSTADNAKRLIKFFSVEFGIDFTNAVMQVAPIIRPWSKKDIVLTKNKIFFIGESAGLVSPTTGEGISYALRSAKICADSINSFDDLDGALKAYQKNANFLVQDIMKKITKAKFFGDVKLRSKFFNSRHA